MDAPLLCKVDAVTVPVPDLDSGLEFYVGSSFVIGCCGATTTSARRPWGCATATLRSC